jgi:hypothetical protein
MYPKTAEELLTNASYNGVEASSMFPDENIIG